MPDNRPPRQRYSTPDTLEHTQPCSWVLKLRREVIRASIPALCADICPEQTRTSFCCAVQLWVNACRGCCTGQCECCQTPTVPNFCGQTVRACACVILACVCVTVSVLPRVRACCCERYLPCRSLLTGCVVRVSAEKTPMHQLVTKAN